MEKIDDLDFYEIKGIDISRVFTYKFHLENNPNTFCKTPFIKIENIDLIGQLIKLNYILTYSLTSNFIDVYIQSFLSA
jgi:hypothetical protein